MPASFRLALLCLAASAAAAAQDAGSRVDYATLHRVLAPAQTLRGFDRLRPVERIESSLPGVRADAIRLTIESARGAIAVPVGADGRLDFPMSDALLRENPPVATIQPKGTLTLTVSFELKLTPGPRVDWRDVEAALAQADAVVRGQGGRSDGAEFDFDPAAHAHIDTEGAAPRRFEADADGRILMPRAVGAQATALRLSTAPRAVLPLLIPVDSQGGS